MNKKTIERIMLNNLKIPDHKIAYLIRNNTLVNGLWGVLKAYGVNFSKENHELLIDIVQMKLEHTKEVEREWSEDEYNNFVLYNGDDL
jgi:uncharacterized membrane protein